MAADTLTKDESIRLMQAEIERLRDDRDSWADQADARVKDCEGFMAEIERLQNANQDLVDERDIFARTLNKRDAEIERLRAAMEVRERDHREKTAEIERLRGLSDITRLDVMWQELVKERYAAEENAKILAIEVQRLREILAEALTSEIRMRVVPQYEQWIERICKVLGK